ncbi:Putative oxidoreductase YncB [hydrothermal vent metagenome]|uniref:Oxidoreductase YncB n=1 Tax=hydrothermal vent metagenome TaxID=652676 RepID=A0A3B0T5I0_9ZZZZ
MTGKINRQLRLARHIKEHEAVSLDLFEMTEDIVPAPGEGQFLVRTEALGTSPAQRAYLMGSDSRFHPPLAIGEIMRGRGVGEVISSRHDDFRPGDMVACSTGWQDYSLQDGDQSRSPVKTLQKIYQPQSPHYLHLGTLGASGFAAYFGLLDIGRPAKGDTVVVSACAGGVGSLVAQIARLKGCRVVGIAGGPEKCDWIRTVVGVDEAIDYKTDDLDEKLKEYCPDGIDVYFDNVGGNILDQALKNLALKGRAVICGLISTEYENIPPPGPRHYYNLIYKRARMEGFFVWDYYERFEAAEAELMSWYKKGALRPTEKVYHGLEAAPVALQSLFSGIAAGIKVIDLGR